MRRSLISALIATLVAGQSIDAQFIDQTLAPRGYLRLQAHPHSTSWDSRYARLADGTIGEQPLGLDLTDPTALTLFPGISTLSSLVGDLLGAPGYTPVLGSSEGRIRQEVTQVDLGGHFGVQDWLTIGVIVPWARGRTTVDALFSPDTVNGDLGLNPRLANRTGVDAFIASTGTASAAAQGYAATICGAGPGGACTSAQGLADRARGFEAFSTGAYEASPFFPRSGSSTADAILLTAAALHADLLAAGLVGLPLPMLLATEWLMPADFPLLPGVAGAGIEATPLQSRKGLWSVGDVEVSALVRLIDNLTPDPEKKRPHFGYRFIGGLIVRLPTGLPEDPNVLFDIGIGDGQTDKEGRLIGSLTLGERLGLDAGIRYGIQDATVVVKRVAPVALVLAPIETLQEVTWKPGSYLAIDIRPALRLSDELALTGEYRFFRKGSDAFGLVDASSGLDPTLLDMASRLKAHQIGGGIRYQTVDRWLAGETTRPLEFHLRVLRTVHGSGGATPATTRVEAGIRLFKRVWGPRY
ncbi:MAG: hypothetical protein O2956_10205 [Gemmatimonadetes bacterium]|nr:hypothetical protein [Gemmatimonadota bacterium]